MQMVVRVGEKGRFSGVAKERGIGQPGVSKQISALENELGTELIHRTSRSIALTEAGRDFYGSALHILDDFESATSRIGRGQTAPKGLIRVTVPPTFARLDRKSTRLNSSHQIISYAVFCLKKKKNKRNKTPLKTQ